jgi:hypothetical protein
MNRLRPASIVQGLPRWRLGLALLLLGASCVQQWAAQAHWHAIALHGQTTLEAPADDSGNGVPAHDCLWCHAGAHAGSAAPPPAWQGLVLADLHSCSACGAYVAAHPAVRAAWSWQSRGPPRI